MFTEHAPGFKSPTSAKIALELKLAFNGNRWASSHLRFSELNSDSRNLRNCSLPTGSFKTSSMPNAHLLTLCWFGSLLLNTQEHNFDWQPMHRIFRSSPLNVSIYIINVETLLQAPRLWCHLRSTGWMGQEVWGKGRIPGTAPCTPANCCFCRGTSKDPPGVQIHTII